MKQENTTSFIDFIRLTLHIKDKNLIYIHNLFAVGCDSSKLNKLYELDNEEATDNLNYYYSLFAIKPIEKKTVRMDGGDYLVKAVKELSTEEWMALASTLENVEHTEQSYIQVGMVITGADEMTVKNADCKELFPAVGFFLSSLQSYIPTIQKYSLLTSLQRILTKKK